jgi:hypothetical protein
MSILSRFISIFYPGYKFKSLKLRSPLPKTVHSTKLSITITWGSQQRPCDELISRPRSTADCPRSSNRSEMESFMEATKAQTWAVEPKGKRIYISLFSIIIAISCTMNKLNFKKLVQYMQSIFSNNRSVSLERTSKILKVYFTRNLS